QATPRPISVRHDTDVPLVRCCPWSRARQLRHAVLCGRRAVLCGAAFPGSAQRPIRRRRSWLAASRLKEITSFDGKSVLIGFLSSPSPWGEFPAHTAVMASGARNLWMLIWIKLPGKQRMRSIVGANATIRSNRENKHARIEFLQE